jgi:hypothetical protein
MLNHNDCESLLQASLLSVLENCQWIKVQMTDT